MARYHLAVGFACCELRSQHDKPNVLLYCVPFMNVHVPEKFWTQSGVPIYCDVTFFGTFSSKYGRLWHHNECDVIKAPVCVIGLRAIVTWAWPTDRQPHFPILADHVWEPLPPGRVFGELITRAFMTSHSLWCHTLPYNEQAYERQYRKGDVTVDSNPGLGSIVCSIAGRTAERTNTAHARH